MTRAVVVGGSVAGLCAARALADTFDEVTVLDRDVFPTDAEERAGVPQGRHVHALLERGRRELEALFPGFTATMRARGAHELDFGWDFAALREIGWQPRDRAPYCALFASRTLIESVVRELLRRTPHVTLRERTAVDGLVAVGNGRPRIAGVRIRPPEGGTATLDADLVVDASGRGSRAPEWLRAIGVAPPAETVVRPFTGYATRWYRAPDPARWPAAWWWKGIWIDPLLPDHTTAGVLMPVEGGRWIVTLAGVERRYPPTDEAAFTAALRQLRSPIIAEAVALAEPLSPIYGNREMENRLRHYDDWDGPPGFVALGDAACKFNPVYGQGMTTAAVAAGVLGTCARETGGTDAGLPTRFFARQAEFLRDPWSLAIGADFRLPSTEGERPRGAALANAYVYELFWASFADVVVRDTVIDVMHMLRSATAFFTPWMVARVCRAALRRRLATAAPAGATPPLTATA
jgi:2-polyprenyl-6-methoxyphenol hydroxylase-like FAD-dependent oxidoreductase